jgi:hypothetical protein
LSLGAVALTGCATQDSADTNPRPRNGIADYRKIAVDADKSMSEALRSLDTVAAQRDQCPAKVLLAFSQEVERLEADSVTVRARAKSMQARGDAYFEKWHENLAQVKDPRVRELATKHRAELTEGFGRIKAASREAGEAFRPFLAGLRQLQTILEKDPSALQASATKDLVRTAREHGQEVQRQLAAIKGELDAAARMVTPGKSTAKVI